LLDINVVQPIRLDGFRARASSFCASISSERRRGKGQELTAEAAQQLEGLGERRKAAKGKAARILQLGQSNAATEAKLEADRQRRLAMQERLVAGTVGRVEEMGLLNPPGMIEQGEHRSSEPSAGKESRWKHFNSSLDFDRGGRESDPSSDSR
jgi:hypothetical protein